jgi:hypothetical protein
MPAAHRIAALSAENPRTGLRRPIKSKSDRWLAIGFHLVDISRLFEIHWLGDYLDLSQ